MTFRDKIADLERIVAAVPVHILVWGPGDTAGPDWEKRKKIRETLTREFPNAQIAFSEDLPDDPSGSDLTLQERELWHLSVSDITIVLDTSKGPGEEIAHFTRTTMSRKLFILTNERYKAVKGFPAALREHENQVFFNDGEYTSCSLIERVLRRAKQVALNKFLEL
jgi:hypothetical protein